MSRKIVYLLCFLFCLGACNDDRLSDSNTDVTPPPGEEVPVNLVLDVAPLSSPLSATTRTDANGAGLRASFSGMEVELTGQPDATTRQFPSLEESKIYSAVIFQFSGATARATCVQAKYIDANGGKLDLSSFTFKDTQSSISRIVVVANVSNDYFNIQEWNAGSKTYQDLLNEHLKKEDYVAYPLYTVSANNRALMFGMTDTKIETGKLVTVVLQRMLAKCSFEINIADALKQRYPVWRAQLLSLPGRSYFIASGRGVPFPSAALLGDNGYYASSSVGANNGVFNLEDLDMYIPVNLQPDVTTATEKTRTLLAPEGGTYLQIMGLKLTSEGSIQEQAIYQIYLGSNFTTNYSISPNTYYKYKIRVKGENPEDGTLVRFIPGYWGGELKAYNATGDVVAFDSNEAVQWRYEKEIEFYPYDVNEHGTPNDYRMHWGPQEDLSQPSSLTNGRMNTWNIQGSSGKKSYQASYACYKLNTGTIGSAQDLMWYQPSISQLLGTYLVCANLLSTLKAGYWSSTSYDTNNAYYLTKYGEVRYGKKDFDYYVRAARDFK